MSGSPAETTQDELTLRPRIEIKISDPAGNRTWAVGLEGRDSTDHATETDIIIIIIIIIIININIDFSIVLYLPLIESWFSAI